MGRRWAEWKGEWWKSDRTASQERGVGRGRGEGGGRGGEEEGEERRAAEGADREEGL